VTAFGFSFGWLPLVFKDNGLSKWYMERVPFYKTWDIQMASIMTLIAAVWLWLCTITLGFMAYKFNGNAISDLIGCAFEVFQMVPGMYYQPAFEAVFKFIVFWTGINGLKIIASEGWVVKNRIVVNGASFAGLSREYIPSVEDPRFYVMALFWIVMWAWGMEVVSSFGQFCVSYEVFKYYGVKKEKNKKPVDSLKPTPLLQAFKYGCIYHFGSILKGAWKILPTRPIRVGYWLGAVLFQDAGQEGCLASCVQKFLACLCGLCVKMDQVLEKELAKDSCDNKDGFHDVVVRSNDWTPSVAKGHQLLEHSHQVVANLYKGLTQQTCATMGVVSIATICSTVVYTMVNNIPLYWKPTSALYVADPVVVCGLTWILTAYIAFGFMTLWDHTADGLLYCYAWSRQWDRSTVDKYIPESLRYIVGFDDTEQDRFPYYGKADNKMYLRTWLPMVGVQGGGKKKAVEEKPAQTRMGTNAHGTAGPAGPAPHGPGGPSSQPEGSWMSGFGTGFGQWGRQTEAVSGEMKPLMY
jgi:hypothetical protein